MSKRLDEIRKRLADCKSPQPWFTIEDRCNYEHIYDAKGDDVAHDVYITDGVLMAHAPADLTALIAVAEAAERFCALHNVTVDVQLSQGSRADFHKWQKDRDALYAAMRVFEGTEER